MQRLNQRTHTLYEKLLRFVCLMVLYISAFKPSTCFRVKNFATNNNQLVAGSLSRIKIHAKEEVSTRSSPIGDWSRGSTIDWYFRIIQGSDKIPYTYNCLILNQWIFGNGNLKFTQWSFCLTRNFSHSSTNQCVHLISTALSFLVICWCLHDLYII